MGQAFSRVSVLVALALLLTTAAMAGEGAGQGTLQVKDKQGKVANECPLKHTSVKASIAGSITRVTVIQEFENPFKTPIEAVYVFPLPQNAAVDAMTMHIGNRVIKGVIKRRDEARKIYDDARKAGRVAALLDQERPNVFTQSVANVMPGASITVEISYVDTLTYVDGQYEFVFPMVVGPRYIPGRPTGQTGPGWAPDTTNVPDASRITPPVAKPGTRAGHDIDLTVSLDAGVPVKNIRSVLHRVAVHGSGSQRTVTLDQTDRIPNKDFILQYETSGTAIEDGVLTHAQSSGNGYFTLILQPPRRPQVSQITPKEMVFVIDSSGSQMGWPIEKAKETMKYCIENMNPGDTFQLLSFANDVTPCFNRPVPNSRDARERAQQWLATRLGSGGTEMMKAIDYALGAEPDPQRMRVVVFMTDGYVGNDMAILGAIKSKLGKARLFPFGVGNSVNRYLLEGMARMGKGEVEWVTLNRHGDEVAEAFQQRIGSPLLLDVAIDWGGAPVLDVYPRTFPDLFSGKPLVIKGRYTAPFKGGITIRGRSANKPYARTVTVDFPVVNPANDVLGVLWARTRIEDLMNHDLTGIQQGTPQKDVEGAVTSLGLEFKLMTQFTSFVAVEERVVNTNGKVETIAVPVEMPEGVSHEGVFGNEESDKARAQTTPSTTSSYPGPALPRPAAMPRRPVTSPTVGVRDGVDRSRDPIVRPEHKLDPSLEGLGARVKREGVNGNLKLTTLEVTGGCIDLIVTVSAVSERALQQLAGVGFNVKTSSKSQRIVTGSLAVDRLADLAGLGCVQRIEPQPAIDASRHGSGGGFAELWSLLSLLSGVPLR